MAEQPTQPAMLADLHEKMSQDDLQRMGEHIKYGPQRLSAFIEHFIIEHDQAHVKQVQTLLAQQGGGL